MKNNSFEIKWRQLKILRSLSLIVLILETASIFGRYSQFLDVRVVSEISNVICLIAMGAICLFFRYWKCPRCRRYFNDSPPIRWLFSKLPCAHCGLPIWSDDPSTPSK